MSAPLMEGGSVSFRQGVSPSTVRVLTGLGHRHLICVCVCVCVGGCYGSIHPIGKDTDYKNKVQTELTCKTKRKPRYDYREILLVSAERKDRQTKLLLKGNISMLF